MTRPFVGCDGEGTTLANGYHAYNMLTIGAESIVAKGNAVRLTTYECLDFISSRDPAAIYVGYFFDYDVTKILEDLPFAKLDRLINRDKRTGTNGALFPVDFMDFQVDYLPHKEFKVRKKLWQKEDHTEWSPWIVINDVGSFFQTPFLTAITNWSVGSDAEREMIRVGKSQRAVFAVEDLDDIAAYNALEIVLLQDLMTKFRDACIDVGYVPLRWQGPGLLAESMLRKHNVPMTKNVPLLQSPEYSGLRTFALNAYYGGRTEVSAAGPVDREVYQYDINSAYPHAMRFVPCLIHGEWEHVKGSACPDVVSLDTPVGKYGERFGLAYGRFTDASFPRTRWYGLPVRTKQGTIVYPADGSGWYWSFEIASGIHQSFQPDELWLYTRVCYCRPLAFVEEVYKERQRIGKDGPGIVLKLGMNSLYGKTVQSIGRPKYANPIWGSFLTAYPRMMIQKFIHSSPYCRLPMPWASCGDDILMVATDSVTTYQGRDYDHPPSKELGAWSTEVHPNGIFIVQPGVYFGTSGKASKTRGVPRVFFSVLESEFRQAFDAMLTSPVMGSVSVPVKTFVGIRQAVHRRNMSLLGQWIDHNDLEGYPGRHMSFDWTSKRHPDAARPNSLRTYIQTFPYQGLEEIETVPYSKDIGGVQQAEEYRTIFDEQPDWALGVCVYD